MHKEENPGSSLHIPSTNSLMSSDPQPQLGIVSAPSNGYLITVTEAIKIVQVTSLQTQRQTKLLRLHRYRYSGERIVHVVVTRCTICSKFPEHDRNLRVGLGISDKKIIPRKTEQTEQLVISDGIPAVPRNRNSRNSVPNPSAEEKTTRNSVLGNKN